MLAWAGVAVALLASGVAAARIVQDTTVKITEKGFSPEVMEIRAGQKVVFQNDTSSDRSVTSRNPAEEGEKEKPEFDSGAIAPSTSWEHQFPKPGRYRYYSKEDKAMIGTIIVNSEK